MCVCLSICNAVSGEAMPEAVQACTAAAVWTVPCQVYHCLVTPISTTVLFEKLCKILDVGPRLDVGKDSFYLEYNDIIINTF